MYAQGEDSTTNLASLSSPAHPAWPQAARHAMALLKQRSKP